MKASFLADEKQFIPTIAQWYFSEWGHLSSGRSQEDIRQKVAAMAVSRQALPREQHNIDLY